MWRITCSLDARVLRARDAVRRMALFRRPVIRHADLLDLIRTGRHHPLTRRARVVDDKRPQMPGGFPCPQQER